MSKEEELFKQHLDAMLSSQSFEMGADNWSGMEMLLKQQQRKRRGFFILFTGLGLLLLSSLLWLLIPQTQSNTNVAETKISTVDLIEKSIPQINSQEQNTAAPAAKAPQAVNASIPKSTSPTSKTNTPQVIKPVFVNVPQQSAQSSNEHNESITMQNANTATNLNTAASIDNAAVNETIAVPSKTVEELAGPQNSISNTVDNSPANSVPPVLTESAATAANEPAPPLNSEHTPLVNKIETPASTASETPTELPSSTNIDSVAKITALKPDTTAALVAKPDTDYVAKKHFCYLLEAGFTALSGWQENDKRDAAGINPLFGAHISYPVTPDLEVAFGLQYTTVGHLKYSKYTATTSHLDLGRVDQSVAFTPIRLHYLIVPIQAFRKLDDKQSIGAGLSFGYLLTADSKVETYTYDYFGTAHISTEKKKGYTEGFRNIDAQVSLHYRYRFTSSLQANIGLMFGLMDVKTGKALPSKSFERISGAKISLLYTLFGK